MMQNTKIQAQINKYAVRVNACKFATKLTCVYFYLICFFYLDLVLYHSQSMDCWVQRVTLAIFFGLALLCHIDLFAEIAPISELFFISIETAQRRWSLYMVVSVHIFIQLFIHTLKLIAHTKSSTTIHNERQEEEKRKKNELNAKKNTHTHKIVGGL